MTQNELIEDLIERTKYCLNTAEKLQQCDVQQLNQKQDKKSWSALEAIEHLNRYGNFYIPEIKKRMDHDTRSTLQKFKTGLLGNYFAKSMLPREKLNKMKTFKSMNPLGSDLDRGTLEKFMDQQKQILDLLKTARHKNLTKIKTSISISKWIHLRLGDTFRVVIYHNQRHIEQAQRAVQ